MSRRLRGRPRTYHYHAAPADDDMESETKAPLMNDYYRQKPSKWRAFLWKALWIPPLVVLVLFGLLHIILVLFGNKQLFWDFQECHPFLSGSNRFTDSRKYDLRHPSGLTRDVRPIPCHSHNDYWRTVPLFDALRSGCTSVEADIWLLENEQDLLVGHDTASLTRDRTLRNLYVDPLVELLDSMNSRHQFENIKGHGVFDMDPSQTLVLLIDFKTDGHDLFPHVSEQLEPLRRKDYLSYWDGTDFTSRAVTVVGTGNAPFDLIVVNKTRRDVFFDAPLDRMYEAPVQHEAAKPAPTHPTHHRPRTPAQGNTGTSGITSPDAFNITNSHYASVSFFQSIGFPWTGRLTSTQLDLIRGQIRGAQHRGLKARYWETPAWPTSLRNRVWEILIREGADVLNVDDLRSAARLDWTEGVGHYLIDA